MQFTPHQLETWALVLGCHYPEDIIIRALVEFGLNADPFPEIGKVLEVCHRIKNERATTPCPGFDPRKPSAGLVKSVMKAFGLSTAFPTTQLDA
ncbi:MAG: hypothetical protein U0936_23455 [Planctomycetaceae bacterium]